MKRQDVADAANKSPHLKNGERNRIKANDVDAMRGNGIIPVRYAKPKEAVRGYNYTDGAAVWVVFGYILKQRGRAELPRIGEIVKAATAILGDDTTDAETMIHWFVAVAGESYTRFLRKLLNERVGLPTHLANQASDDL
jgi:hypothetical protein